MATAVTTNTTELGDSRVRVDVEVPAGEIERELNSAAQALAGQLRIPGFRKGKIPPPVVLQHVGREAVLEEAVRRGLPQWYEDAVIDARLAPVGDPKLDMPDLPDKGQPLAFTIEVNVRPKAKLGDYKGVEVGRRDAEVKDEDVEAGLKELRERLASLENVEREARNGDFVVLDFTGRVDGEEFEGGEARGYLLELGSGRLIEGFEDQLVGAKPGEEREVNVTFPADYPNEGLAGRDASFATTVKEVKEKRLPELDDDFAAEAGGFDSIDELREDVTKRMREQDERAIDGEYREAVVDAVAQGADIDVPHELVHAKAHEMWHHTANRLRSRGMDPAQFLQMTGKEEEELVTESEPEAEKALRRESVLAAVVDAESIEVSDDEILDALREAATSATGQPPSEKTVRKTFERAKKEGRDEGLREDIAMRKAVELLVENAKPISVEQAQARDKLWTPEKDAEEKASELWTPGSS